MQRAAEEKQAGNYTIGVGSFSYRYAIGSPGFRPDKPMSVLEFLRRAYELGFSGVQLCENLQFAQLSQHELEDIKKYANELGLFLEVGMRHLTVENAVQHIRIARQLGSKFVRVVVGDNSLVPDREPAAVREQAVAVIKQLLPELKQTGITMGIENHFDLPTDEIARLLGDINDSSVGWIFDTTNCLGFIEKPTDVLKKLAQHLVSIHLKDYNVRKVEAGYLVSGTVLGQGWLDCRQIIEDVLKVNPSLSIIIEMSIRRKEDAAIDEVLAAEHQSVAKSIEYLRSLLQELEKRG